MKKLLAVLLIMTMSISLLVGCGGSDKDTNKEPNKGNGSNANQDAGNDDEESRGIQKVTIKVMEDVEVTISYDADVLECDGDEYGVFFYELDGDSNFSVSAGHSANEIIESHKGYDWMEDYTASAVKDQFINGILVQNFKETYKNDGEPRENEIYCVPFSGFAIVVEGEFTNPDIIEKALVNVECEGASPVREDSVVTLKDPSGKEIYKIYLTPQKGESVKLISNENGKATFEYTGPTQDGEVITRPVEISVNAYASGSQYYASIAGKYWTTYPPFEWENTFGGKYVKQMSFWDQKEGDSRVQYQDNAFYIELPDGNLITGICDANQEYAVYCFFSYGFTPVQ